MGRKVTDGQALDITLPAGSCDFGELIRVDYWTGFAMDTIASGATDRGLALDVSKALYRCKVPVGVAAARGDFVSWATGAGYKKGETDLTAIAAPTDGSTPILAVAKVEGVRNASGYATLKLVHY